MFVAIFIYDQWPFHVSFGCSINHAKFVTVARATQIIMNLNKVNALAPFFILFFETRLAYLLSNLEAQHLLQEANGREPRSIHFCLVAGSARGL